jgi:hypothetical protein
MSDENATENTSNTSNTKTRCIDDYDFIRRRMEELRGEKQKVLQQEIQKEQALDPSAGLRSSDGLCFGLWCTKYNTSCNDVGFDCYAMDDICTEP